MIRDTEENNKQALLILKSGGRMFSLYVLSQIARLRNGPDFLRTITEERVASKNADERITKYAKLAPLWYKAAVTNVMGRTGKVLSILVRDQEFPQTIRSEVDLQYLTMALSEDWLRGALPKLF